MKKIKKILFPINFVDKYWIYLPWVTTFTELSGATLYLLYVTQDLEEIASLYAPPESIQRFQEKAMRAAQEKMEGAAQKFFNNFSKLETRVAVGKPAQKILEVANQERVDLIIMGTHGRKGLEYTIFGSVCREVLRDASCPVVSINPQKAQPHSSGSH
jgi:nucleotide-binding universal stress UspA family protein